MIEVLQTLTARGEGRARQTLISPSVYLDTWAIREFSENPQRGERFRTALLRSKGTLALSDINLVEFASLSNPIHAQAAGRFVDSLLPHLFLMKCDPSIVIENERKLLAGLIDQSPAGDVNALSQFATAAVRRRGRFSMAAWFDIVHSERAALGGQLSGIAQVFYTQLRKLRELMSVEPDCLDLVPDPSYVRHSRPATQLLLQAIVRDLQADHALPEDHNSAIDLLHSVVPGAYCDFVLLDGQWSVRLRSAASKLSAASVPIKLRGTYSKRNEGLEKFLKALEVWPAAPTG